MNAKLKKTKVLQVECGLIPLKTTDPRIERWSVSHEDLRRLPFFSDLDVCIRGVLDHLENSFGLLEYVIWGGVAVNLLLCLTRRCQIHYAFHDVELLLIKNDKIFESEYITGLLRSKLMSKIMLDIGGVAIARIHNGETVNSFGCVRAGLLDGDLLLNHVILIVNNQEQRVIIEAPSGTVSALLCGESDLEMHDASGLKTIDRVARRLYRTISKAIRFERVCGLSLSRKSLAALSRMIDFYIAGLQGFFEGGRNVSKQECAQVENFFNGIKIKSTTDGHKWLFERVVSETAMRLAGIYGLSSLDRTSFVRLVLGGVSSGASVFEHPLIRLLGKGLGVQPSITDRSEIAGRIYEAFRNYQRPGAELLKDKYSPKILTI